MITAQTITESYYRFMRGDGSVISNAVLLLPNGKVLGTGSVNESTWTLDADVLSFRDHRGDVTTVFTDMDDADGLTFSGCFRGNPQRPLILKAHAGDRNHGRLLDILPNREEQKPMLVLIRSHLVNDKLYDLVSRFNRETDLFDIAIVYDRTHGTPSKMPDADVIWHSEAECLAMGLPKKDNRLLWWCGDFPFYFALTQKPNYRYYAMVEYDVHFTEDPTEFFTKLIGLLSDREGKAPIDALGPRFRLEDGPIGLQAAMRHKYESAYSYFFPLIVLSKAAASFLYKQRLLDAALKIPSDGIGHCESFVPTELIYNGFYCSDLNVLMPGTYDNDLMILPVPFGLPVSMADGFEGLVSLIHPVYGDEQHLTNIMDKKRSQKELKHFIGTLDTDQFARIPAETRARVAEKAMKRLAEMT